MNKILQEKDTMKSANKKDPKIISKMQNEKITDGNAYDCLPTVLMDLEDKYILYNLSTQNLCMLLSESILRYLKNDDLTDNEKKIGDMMRRNIFGAIYSIRRSNNKDFIVNVLKCMNGYLNTYSDGSWNDTILKDALLYSNPKRIRFLSLFVEYAGYKTDMDI